MTPTFHDLAEMPEDEKQRPLCPELPVPPICWIGGVKCTLERVRIDKLADWEAHHGLKRLRTAYMGRELGHVSVYWPENEKGGKK